MHFIQASDFTPINTCIKHAGPLGKLKEPTLSHTSWQEVDVPRGIPHDQGGATRWPVGAVRTKR